MDKLEFLTGELEQQRLKLRAAEEMLANDWTLKASQDKVNAMYKIGELNRKIAKGNK